MLVNHPTKNKDLFYILPHKLTGKSVEWVEWEKNKPYEFVVVPPLKEMFNDI
jgi:hypothetical protein